MNFKRKRGKHMEGGDRPPRHPPHLRGKAIGLYYANLKRERERNGEGSDRPPKVINQKPVGEVLLSDSKKSQLSNLLENTKNDLVLNEGQESSFRKKYNENISGKIEDKLNNIKQMNRNPELDKQLLTEYENCQIRPDYVNMLTKRKQLPSYKKRDEILQTIEANQVVVVSGETGCGKTTQVAQFILEDYIAKGNGSLCHIVCSQPRRISAISVAERVAQERTERLGIGVGYHIRLEHVLPRTRGSIVFCTTGIILRQMETDLCLSNASHIILDEIHERDVMSDFLITLLKQVISKRKDLKLILMSATLNAEKFSAYFDGCPHLNIPGFTYPVQEFFLEDVLQRTNFRLDNWQNGRNSRNRKASDSLKSYLNFIEPYVRNLEKERTYSKNVCNQLRNPDIEELNVDLIFALLMDICEREKEDGAILVFLTGLAEISKLIKLMRESGLFPPHKFLIIPLHSQMPTVNQKEVFNRPPQGVRKIVVSTNIAETSITIDDVVFVIDCGKIKLTNFDIDSNTQTLRPQFVSLANANQRSGRAGRVQAGVCFHLYTKARKLLLEEYQLPEILRTRLDNTILTVKVLQLGKTESFLGSLLDPPQPESIAISLNLLKRLNALDENENLTPLGYHLAKLPLSLEMGKMILLAAIFGCVNPILSVAAGLDFKDAFQIPLGLEKVVDEKKKKLSNGWKSDHLLLHQALSEFETFGYDRAKKFCWDNFLSWKTLTELQKMKLQFMEHLFDMKFVDSKDPKDPKCNINSGNLCLVKAIISAGLYPKVAIVKCRKHTHAVQTINGERAKLHPKSVLSRENCVEAPLLVYYLKLHSTSNYIHDATMVHPLPLIFFGDNYNFVQDGPHSNITLGVEKLKFKCSLSTSTAIKELRDRLNLLLEYKITNPGIVNWSGDNAETRILRAVMDLITSEDLGDIDFDAFGDDY